MLEYQFCVNLKELDATEAVLASSCQFEEQYDTIVTETLLETLTTKDFCSVRDKFDTALDILNPRTSAQTIILKWLLKQKEEYNFGCFMEKVFVIVGDKTKQPKTNMARLSAMNNGIQHFEEDYNKKGLLFEPSNIPITYSMYTT